MPNSIRSLLLRIARNDLPAMLVYFGLRALGAAPYIALCATVLFAVCQMVFEMVRGREADVFLVAMIALYGTGALVALATRDARYAQIANVTPSVIVSAWLFASAFTRKPLTLTIAQRYWPSLGEAAVRGRGWPPQDVRAYLRTHRHTSLVSGLVELVMSVAVIAVVLTCPVDVAMLFNEIAGSGATILVVIYAVKRIRGCLRSLGEAPQTAADALVARLE
jgi:hypothetical protein